MHGKRSLFGGFRYVEVRCWKVRMYIEEYCRRRAVNSKQKLCVNFENKDKHCFLYSISSAIDVHNKKKFDHLKRVKTIRNIDTQSMFSGFEYSMSLSTFERRSFN